MLIIVRASTTGIGLRQLTSVESIDLETPGGKSKLGGNLVVDQHHRQVQMAEWFDSDIPEHIPMYIISFGDNPLLARKTMNNLGTDVFLDGNDNIIINTRAAAATETACVQSLVAVDVIADPATEAVSTRGQFRLMYRGFESIAIDDDETIANIQLAVNTIVNRANQEHGAEIVITVGGALLDAAGAMTFTYTNFKQNPFESRYVLSASQFTISNATLNLSPLWTETTAGVEGVSGFTSGSHQVDIYGMQFSEMRVGPKQEVQAVFMS